MDENTPLYNSRIPRMFLEYIQKHYPEANIQSILKNSQLTEYEINDHGHWFSQSQINKFHEALDREIGHHNLSREVGRFYSSGKGMGPASQYILGLISIASAYKLMGKIYSRFSRGMTVETKQLSSNAIEIIVWPKKGVQEKPFQCENRTGGFESTAKYFTKTYAKIDHPQCIHRGDRCCQYIISWEKSLSLNWKRIRNYCIPISIIPLFIMYFILSPITWSYIFLVNVILLLSLTSISDFYEKTELSNILESQSDVADKLIDQIDIRHDHAELIQEIGQAISLILDIDKLAIVIANAMKEYLDFDRGVIMLANKERTRLIYIAGYGQTKEQENMLRGTEFHLDKPTSRGIFVQTFKKKVPFLQDNAEEIQKGLSKRSIEFAEMMKVQSVICVPIIYETKALGIIAVDNIKTKRKLTKSDMNLLMGIASQTATSINNAMSFKKLHESEERFRAIFESTTDSIFIWDKNYNYLYANKSALKLVNKNHDEVIGKNIIDVLGDIPESMDVWTKKIDEVFKTGQPMQLNDTRTYKDRIIHSENELAPIKDADGNAFAVGIVYRDITEREQAKEEKSRLQAQLRQAQKMEAIGTLAGGIAHDFNNILFPIIGYSEMIMDDMPEGSATREDLEEILKAGMRAKDLVQQILTFSHKHDQEQVPMLIHPVIKEALKLLRSVIPSNIEFKTSIDPNCGSVMADPMQIHQIIMNLCTNAYHAMREDGGILEVSIDKVTLEGVYRLDKAIVKPEKNYVRLIVKDTGKGMSSDVKERIFEPYYTTKEVGEGTGMGLSIVHGIIKSHNGTIKVDSSPGMGTTFEICFPQIDSEADEKIIRDEIVPTGNERIMLVDDDTMVIAMVEKMLNKLGYSVSAWTNSLDALSSFRQHPYQYDLVLSDMTMPNMTGKQLTQKILEERPDMPVILCTGFSDMIDEEKAKAIGAKELITKPISINVLGTTIRNAIDQSKEKSQKQSE